MALNPSNSSSLEQLALKGLTAFIYSVLVKYIVLVIASVICLCSCKEAWKCELGGCGKTIYVGLCNVYHQ